MGQLEQKMPVSGHLPLNMSLWEDLVKLITCDHSSTKDRTLDMVAREGGSQSTLFLKEVGVRAPYFLGKWESEYPTSKSRRGKWESEHPMERYATLVEAPTLTVSHLI